MIESATIGNVGIAASSALFDGSTSVPAPVTVTRLTTDSADGYRDASEDSVRTSSTVTSSPGSIVPREQSAPLQLPCDEVADVKSSGAGRTSVNWTSGAGSAPSLRTVIV